MTQTTISPKSWRERRKLSMAGMARMLGISGKNPSRTWQRYETGEQSPPLILVARIEIISEGQVTTTSWLKAREDYSSKRTSVSA